MRKSCEDSYVPLDTVMFGNISHGIGGNDQIKLEHWKENHVFHTFQNRNIWEKDELRFAVWCFLVISFPPEWIVSSLANLDVRSKSRQMQSNDLLLPATSQTVSVKSNVSLNKAGALVFSALHLWWDIIIAWMSASSDWLPLCFCVCSGPCFLMILLVSWSLPHFMERVWFVFSIHASYCSLSLATVIAQSV